MIGRQQLATSVSELSEGSVAIVLRNILTVSLAVRSTPNEHFGFLSSRCKMNAYSHF